MIPGIMAGQMRVGGGGAPIAYPEIRSVILSSSAVSTHTNTITDAANSEIGDRLFLMLCVRSSNAPSIPSGWSFLAGASISATIGIHIFYRTKTSHSATVSSAIPGSSVTAGIAFAIKAGTFDPASTPVVSSASSGSNTTIIDPPVATDSAGEAPHLAVALASHAVNASVTTWPLPDSQTVNALSSCTAIMCASSGTFASLDPGIIGVDTAASGRAVTVLIRGT